MPPEFEAIDPGLEAVDSELGAADPASAGSCRRLIIFDVNSIGQHKKAASLARAANRIRSCIAKEAVLPLAS